MLLLRSHRGDASTTRVFGSPLSSRSPHLVSPHHAPPHVAPPHVASPRLSHLTTSRLTSLRLVRTPFGVDILVTSKRTRYMIINAQLIQPYWKCGYSTPRLVSPRPCTGETRRSHESVERSQYVGVRFSVYSALVSTPITFYVYASSRNS